MSPPTSITPLVCKLIFKWLLLTRAYGLGTLGTAGSYPEGHGNSDGHEADMR